LPEDISVSRIKNTGDSSRYGYGNPIRRATRKVPRMVLGLQDHALEVKSRHFFHKTLSKIILRPVSVSFDPGKINVIPSTGETLPTLSIKAKIVRQVHTA
jgi:hypothetical protein